jgi:hypothetical protein
MTKDQFQAAVRSLATELHRVAHKHELPADDELAYEVFAARGYIGGAVPDLCPHNLTALRNSFLRCMTWPRTMIPTTTPSGGHHERRPTRRTEDTGRSRHH